jgi:hypothetical protein
LNSAERLSRRLKGEPVDRPPNFDIFMTFAAHFIGEPLSRYYQDYRVLSRANFAVREAFDLDILQAISDPYREAADLGLQVEFPEGWAAGKQNTAPRRSGGPAPAEALPSRIGQADERQAGRDPFDAGSVCWRSACHGLGRRRAG